MENELKPCPFCGGDAIIDYGMGINKYWVLCDNEKCGLRPMTDAYANKSVAKKVWNRRATDERAD